MQRAYTIVFTYINGILTFYKLFHFNSFTTKYTKLITENELKILEETQSVEKSHKISFSRLMDFNLYKKDCEFIYSSQFSGTISKFVVNIKRDVYAEVDRLARENYKKYKICIVIHANGAVTFYKHTNYIQSDSIISFPEKTFISIQHTLPLETTNLTNVTINETLLLNKEFIQFVEESAFLGKLEGALSSIKIRLKQHKNASQYFSGFKLLRYNKYK